MISQLLLSLITANTVAVLEMHLTIVYALWQVTRVRTRGLEGRGGGGGGVNAILP